MTGIAEIIDENTKLRSSMEALERLLAEQKATYKKLLAGKEAELAELDEKYEKLKAIAEEWAQELELIRQKLNGPASQRDHSGPKKPEGASPFSDVEPPPRLPKAERDEKSASGKKGKRNGKTPKRRNREKFARLQSREVRCKADSAARCAGCGGELKVIGQARSFRINWVPGHFVVDDVSRDKCTCPRCPQEGVLTVPSPYALDRAMCGNSLLSRVIVDKFADHLPLNRQARRMKREGFQVGTNTLAGWVKRSAELLSVVTKAIHADLLKGDFIQGDDTGLPVQDGGNGRLRKGRLWAFTNEEQVFYAFTPTKEGIYPAELLKDYRGELILVDGGSEFNEVVRNKELERAGCWSHLRTYFFNARHEHRGEAWLAIKTIRDIFMIEREIRGKSLDEVRAVRNSKARPLVDGFFTWVKALSDIVRPKSLFGKAVLYASRQEKAMRLYLDNPELPIHNNLSELMLRQAVVGRKNWLFAGSEGGADAAATLYTLIGSCMLQGIDPQEYLVDVLGRIQEHPHTRVNELTPKEWRMRPEDHLVDVV